MLSSRVLSVLFCVLLSVHFSAPYVIMGMIHASSRVHIVWSWIPLKFSSPAINRTVCNAALVFLLISCMWLSRLFLVFMISPRYLYWAHGSMCISLIPRVGSLFLDFLMVMVCDLFFPNCILYLLAVSSVIFTSVFWSLMLSVIISTSSTHSRQVELGLMVDSFSCFAFWISLFISSMRAAY